MPFWYFFVFQFKYKVGWSELLVGVSMMPLLHLFSILAKLSSTISSLFAWFMSKICRVHYQKYSCSLYKASQGFIIISRSQSYKCWQGFIKKISCSDQKGRQDLSLFLVLNPKRWVRLRQKFFWSNQKGG